MGRKTPPGNRKPEEVHNFKDEITRRYEDGESPDKIGDDLRFQGQYVRKWLKKWEVLDPHRKKRPRGIPLPGRKKVKLAEDSWLVYDGTSRRSLDGVHLEWHAECECGNRDVWVWPSAVNRKLSCGTRCPLLGICVNVNCGNLLGVANKSGYCTKNPECRRIGKDRSRPPKKKESSQVLLAGFQRLLGDHGYTLVEKTWLGYTPHQTRCKNGHIHFIAPHWASRVVGMCCIFAEFVTAQGGKMVGPYLNNNTPVACTCAKGHPCQPTLGALQGGGGICWTCGVATFSGELRTEAMFREKVHEVGCTPRWGEWHGVNERHNIECPVDGILSPLPGKVLYRGYPVCAECGKRNSRAARTAKRAEHNAELYVAYVAAIELRAYVLECQVNPSLFEAYHETYPVRCPEGHVHPMLPANFLKGHGCRSCAGQDPAEARRKFELRVEALCGTITGTYRNTSIPVPCICAKGHPCNPMPSNVIRGQGICTRCAGKNWDIFYVVTSPARFLVQFGITSGDERPRLHTHKRPCTSRCPANCVRHGYTHTVRLVKTLPPGVALDTENQVKRTLRLAGEKPAEGSTEIFDISCLATILDIVDGWLAGGLLAERCSLLPAAAA